MTFPYIIAAKPRTAAAPAPTAITPAVAWLPTPPVLELDAGEEDCNRVSMIDYAITLWRAWGALTADVEPEADVELEAEAGAAPDEVAGAAEDLGAPVVAATEAEAEALVEAAEGAAEATEVPDG